MFSGRPPSIQFWHPQHAESPPGCSFSAPSRHARYAGAAPVEGVLAKMINIYANTGAKMAADLQVFSSDSLFSRLPATVATTPLQYEQCSHPTCDGSLFHPLFFLFFCLSLRACFSPPIRKLSALPMLVVFNEYICKQQIRVYSIHPFRCKVSYRLSCLKGRSTFRRSDCH